MCQSEAIEFVGQLHISNPYGLYVEVPDWPTHPGLYLDITGSPKLPTKRMSITNKYDDQSISLFNRQKTNPMPLPSSGLWAFRGNVVRCNPAAATIVDRERLAMLIECCIDAFVDLESPPGVPRRTIPRSVRVLVWQRDQGRCVECSSQENLEYDHIIPVIKGGSNTERNIRLLCETCNRRKGADI
jgi:5-methylcytosine-specific restriction endonuclease McrA